MQASYLDETIALVRTQIAILDAATKAVEAIEGPAIDVGLGNGRTYSHLRECMPQRDIYTFDTELKAATASVPPADHLILGDIRETMPFVLKRMQKRAVLLHCDISTGDPTANLARESWLSSCLAEVAAGGALVISRLLLKAPYFEPVDIAELGVSRNEAPLYGSHVHLYKASTDIEQVSAAGMAQA